MSEGEDTLSIKRSLVQNTGSRHSRIRKMLKAPNSQSRYHKHQQQNEMSNKNKIPISEIDAQMLITDIMCMREFITDNNTIVTSRINMLLTLLPIMGGGLAFLYQTGIEFPLFIGIALISTFALFSIGLVVLQEIVDRDIFIVDYIRAINRIRACFVENAPYMEHYLLMPTSHNIPEYDWQSVKRHIPLTINSIIVGMMIPFFVLAMQTFTSLSALSIFTELTSLIAIGATSAALSFVAQARYCKNRVKRAKEKRMIKKDGVPHVIA